MEGKVRTSFFEKKEAKKLLLLGAVATPLPQPPGAKVFWFFFSKKNRFPFFLPPRILSVWENA
jgi:hypothetical protein